MAAALAQLTARLDDLSIHFERTKEDLLRAGHEIGLLKGRLLAQAPLVNQVPELRVQAAKAIGLSVRNKILQERVDELEAELAQLRGSQRNQLAEAIVSFFQMPSRISADTVLMPLVVLITLMIIVGTTVEGLRQNWWM